MSGGHDAWKGHVDRLRQVVLQSADVLPGEVAAYLAEVAAADDWERSRAVLAEPAALMRHLPSAFADFALAVLTPRASRHRRAGLGDDGDLLGDLYFFPPAHVQGPFLGLLYASEEHGLRLIHGLVNGAVRRWRASAEANGWTPLPVRVELPSGTRELWGDESVYYWFRTHGTASNTVASVLMALEAWLEAQIAAGRPAEELFDRVLRESECVAVAGVCLSVALKYDRAALRAVLPLLAAPALWSMDVVRSVHDGNPAELPAAFAVPTLPQHAHVEKLRSARDAEPHRGRNVRELVMVAMAYGGEDVRAALERAGARFTVDLLFRYAGEEADEAHVAELREKIEEYQALCVASNYHDAEVDGRVGIVFELPAELAARNAEARDAAAEGMLAITLDQWARRAREAGAGIPEEGLAAAVASARKLQRDGDFSQPASLSTDPGEAFRLRAIAATAAAVLMGGYRWAGENDTLAWCRDILVAAAGTPLPDDGSDSRYGIDDGDPRVSAAQGLTRLVAHGHGDPEVRARILDLVADTRMRVPGAVMAGLEDAWDADPALCWNALALGLALAQVSRAVQPPYGVGHSPAEAAWRAGLVAEAERRVAAGELPALPRLPRDEDGWYFAWNLAPKLLAPLPLARLAENPGGKAALLQLLDDFMAWTVAQNLPREVRGRRVDANPPYQWNQDFTGWAASFARALPEADVAQHILTPVREVFEEAPDLTAGLLMGYVNHHLGFLAEPPPASVRQWKEIAAWVLASESVRGLAGERHMGHTIAHAATLPIFVREQGPALRDVWPHAPLFADMIARWVETLGTNAYAFACLLLMLEGLGWNLAPAPALEWVADCVERSNADRLLGTHDNAGRLAAFLQRIWHEHAEALLADAAQRARYSGLVDRLVGRGIALASVLQRRLEERTRGR